MIFALSVVFALDRITSDEQGLQVTTLGVPRRMAWSEITHLATRARWEGQPKLEDYVVTRITLSAGARRIRVSGSFWESLESLELEIWLRTRPFGRFGSISIDEG